MAADAARRQADLALADRALEPDERSAEVMRKTIAFFETKGKAKLLADYGDCGKPVCCNTHMTVIAEERRS